MEIERKFLVKDLSFVKARLRWRRLRQGYLCFCREREVRIRDDGGNFSLTCKEGSGLARKETETGIHRRQFEQLWIATEGRRLEKERAAFRVGRHTVEVDRYLGGLAPLCVAEVEFASIAESKKFLPFDFLGREVTGQIEYANHSLAMYGLPPQSITYQQAGAVPFLWRNGALHLVLVTNSSQNRWILPKGCLEPNMTPQDVALMETAEEAGAIGTILSERRAGFHPPGREPVLLYALHVTCLLKKWPESGRRRRRVMPLKAALRLLKDPQVEEVIEHLLPNPAAGPDA